MDLLVLCVACLTVLVNCLVKQFAMCMGVVTMWLFKDLMQSYNTSGYFSFYVDNINKTYSTWNFSKIPTKS